MKNQPNKATVKDGAKREQTGFFLKQQPILDGDIVAQHCEMVDDYSGKVSTQLNRLLVCWNGKDWDVKCLDSMVGYRNQYWGCMPAFHEVVGNAVDNPEMIPSEVEWTRKDSEPVKDGLPTAEQFYTEQAPLKNIPADFYVNEVSEIMQSYSDQQNAELREEVERKRASLVAMFAVERELKERVKELEVGNNRILNKVNEINQLAKQSRVNVTMRIIELETKNDRLCEALKKIADRFDPETQDFEGIIRIAEEAIKQNEK